MKAARSALISGTTLLVALMMGSLLLVGVLSFLAFTRIGDDLAALLGQQRSGLERIQLASSAERAFQVQVQEWKNLLIRGQDPVLFNKHLSAFETQAAKVQDDLERLDPLLVVPANRARLRALRMSHSALLQKYRAALSTFDAADLNSPDVIDGLIRGIDRPVGAEFGGLAGAVQTYALGAAERVSAQVDATAASGRERIVVASVGITLAVLALALLITRSMHGILERQRAIERELQASEVRYRQLFELSPYGVLVRSGARWVVANPKAVQMFGAACAADIVGRLVTEFVHPEWWDRVRERIRCLDEGLAYGEPKQVLLLRVDGSSFIGETSAVSYLHDGMLGSLLLLQDVTARNRIEEERDQFFALCIDMLGIAGTDGFFKRVNPAFGHTLGWTDAELTERPFLEFVHPEDAEATLREMAKLAAGESTLRFENRYRCKDGTWRWLAWAASASHDGLIYAAARDLTATKCAEAALRASEEYNRTIVESSQDCFRVLSLDGSLLQMSTLGRHLMGVTDFQANTNADWLSFWEGAWREAALAAVEEARSGGIGRFQGFARTVDGQDKWWDVIVSPIRGADGKPERLLGMARDITQQRQSEQAIRTLNADLESRVERRTGEIRSQQAFLHKVIDLNPSLIYAKDLQGRYVLANEALAKVNRTTVEAILGKTDAELNFDAVMVKQFRDQDLIVLNGLHDLVIEDEQVTDAAGRMHRWNTLKRPILAPGGQERLVLGVSTDITRQKAAEAEIYALNADLERRVVERTSALEASNRQLGEATFNAEQASRAKSVFLAAMSHEIRTPMNGVIGMVDVLGQSHLATDQADAVETIRASAFALLRIIDDILDFSKIEAGRLDIEHSAVCLTELVEDVCDTLVPVASGKGVDLAVFIDPAAPERVMADLTRLRSVLYNLIGNAIKFSAGRPEVAGSVAVRVEIANATPLRLAFTIGDNGIGIAPEALQRLFKPFMQAESSTTRRFGGTGLGLAISQRLVSLMGGTIDVVSRAGTGSTFTVSLPFDAAADESERGREWPDLTGVECILVASPDLCADDLRAYLLHAGAAVHCCSDGVAAVRLAARLTTTGTAPVVAIQAGGHGRHAAQALRAPFADMPAVRHLLIAKGRRRHARVTAPDAVTLDAIGLRRSTLLRAVAVAAGRASPQVARHDTIHKLQRATAPSITEARAQGRLILLVEDDEINQKVILRQLALLGYAAEVANDGEQALQLWRVGAYALLLTDLHMPRMDGYALVEAIRRAEAEEEAAPAQVAPRGIPILALTANALREEAVTVLAAGMDECLTKPIQLQVLDAALRRWLPEADSSPAPLAAIQEPSACAPPARAVDVSVLEALVGDDAETVREFLTDYLDSIRPAAELLRAACARGDAREVGAITHRLKSSSRSVGALALGDRCAELENASRAGGRADLLLERKAFELELHEVEMYICAYFEGMSKARSEAIR
jgi:PAS domain S-box-containing protein